MARYEHLPIYKKALDVAVHFEKTAAGFPRYYYVDVGAKKPKSFLPVIPARAGIKSF